MSGISSGTRLQQLEELRQRIDQEIAYERRQHPTPRRPNEIAATSVLLAELGVTAKHVKEWACTQGLIPVVARGRVALGLVEAYAAHMGSRDDRGDNDTDPTGEPR